MRYTMLARSMLARVPAVAVAPSARLARVTVVRRTPAVLPLVRLPTASLAPAAG
jgi:hypothetical protein